MSPAPEHLFQDGAFVGRQFHWVLLCWHSRSCSLKDCYDQSVPDGLIDHPIYGDAVLEGHAGCRFPQGQISLSSQVLSVDPSTPICCTPPSMPRKVVSARYASVVRK